MTLCRHVPPSGKSKGRAKLWAFSVYDLAKLFCTTPAAVRKRVQRGLDPTDLELLFERAQRARRKVSPKLD